MATKTVRIGAEIDKETDVEFGRWAEREGRSKRRHLAILARKLTTLQKTRPDDLARLGLLDHSTADRP
jgi:hypothetical protein